jgi:hypothetical protein
VIESPVAAIEFGSLRVVAGAGKFVERSDTDATSIDIASGLFRDIVIPLTTDPRID